MALKTYPLTTAQRFADYNGLGTLVVGSAKELLIITLINSVTEFIENYIGYRVQQSTITNEEYDTEAGDVLNLKRWPVSSVTLQRRNSALNNDEWETIDSSYYFVDTDAGIIYGAGGWDFPRSRRGYRVTYTAGYDFDNALTFLADTEGGDLELAAWILMATVYGRRKGGGGIKSESIGDYRVVYHGTLMQNEDVKDILDKYGDSNLGATLTPTH